MDALVTRESENVLFSVHKLACAYRRSIRNECVLYIDKLEIPKGKLVFLLGASGCGKSTLLETLGLMNNTISDGTIHFYPNEKSDPVNLADLWKDENYAALTEVRKKNYSFIFQNTNLMENFTAYENVCLAGMIKENVTQEAVLEDARALMNKIKLTDQEVNLKTLAVNLSGGQRQRLAFVRALNNKATVLFGDEPTGNLDEANAQELFEIIKSNLDGGLSAVVVSHDINLAVKYADQIIVITKNPQKGFGEIQSENIFNRDSWQHQQDHELDLFRKKLKSFYHADHEQRTVKSTEATKVDTGINYRKLFLRKEGKILFGKSRRNLGVLSLILFFTFLAIGFANGSLEYLDKKMNSAFVNWVTVSIPFGRSGEDQMSVIMSRLDDPEFKNTYLYQSVTPFSELPIDVYDIKRKNFFPANSRTVDVKADKKLIDEVVLNRNNIVFGDEQGFSGDMDISLIVTKSFLAEFGYDENANVIYCQKTVVKDTSGGQKKYEDIKVPLPVKAIVHQLPGKYDIIYPVYFQSAFFEGINSAFDITRENQKICLFYPETDIGKTTFIRKTLNLFFESQPDFYAKFQPGDVYQEDYKLGFLKGTIYTVDFLNPLYAPGSSDSLTNTMVNFARTKGVEKQATRTYRYEEKIDDNYEEPTYDQISVYFNSLDNIKEFAKALKKRMNKSGEPPIEVDVNKVTEKENFNFLSKVTIIISSLLVIFSILAIVLFVSNLLVSHLSKVKMNIGTFKAIGLPDSEARNIYFMIIFFFVISSVAIALILASLVGYLTNLIFTQQAQVDQGIRYFKIIDIKTGLALLSILLFSFLVSWATIKKILNKTPGDLIYNR